MLSDADLNAPAQLRYERAGAAVGKDDSTWADARSFPSVREALHVSMSEQAPPGQVAYSRTGSGQVLTPEVLEQLWSSVQGP